MESLESRIARLAPEQQQEVSDFVDFLLLKNNLRQPAPVQPSLIMVNTPPVMAPDPLLPAIPPLQAVQQTPVSPEPVIPAEEPPSAIHEITAGGDEWLTREYMDYGQFDGTSSPATEAVAKVKRKIIAREEKDRPGHILDWVD